MTPRTPRVSMRCARGGPALTFAPVTASDSPRDPDEERRIRENKQWRRDQPPEDVWDIDKERDALMYKRESLERLLRLTPAKKDGDADAKDDASKGDDASGPK